MSRRVWGWSAPLFCAALVFWGSGIVFAAPGVIRGVRWGVVVALAQSFLSTGALSWAWRKKSFYGVWAAAMLGRFLVVGIVAFVVVRATDLSLVATLTTLVVSTTFFLVVESVSFFPKKK